MDKTAKELQKLTVLRPRAWCAATLHSPAGRGSEGEVRWQERLGGTWQGSGTVHGTASRSYIVETPSGRHRHNRRHLKVVPEGVYGGQSNIVPYLPVPEDGASVHLPVPEAETPALSAEWPKPDPRADPALYTTTGLAQHCTPPQGWPSTVHHQRGLTQHCTPPERADPALYTTRGLTQHCTPPQGWPSTVHHHRADPALYTTREGWPSTVHHHRADPALYTTTGLTQHCTPPERADPALYTTREGWPSTVHHHRADPALYTTTGLTQHCTPPQGWPSTLHHHRADPALYTTREGWPSTVHHHRADPALYTTTGLTQHSAPPEGWPSTVHHHRADPALYTTTGLTQHCTPPQGWPSTVHHHRADPALYTTTGLTQHSAPPEVADKRNFQTVFSTVHIRCPVISTSSGLIVNDQSSGCWQQVKKKRSNLLLNRCLGNDSDERLSGGACVFFFGLDWNGHWWKTQW